MTADEMKLDVRPEPTATIESYGVPSFREARMRFETDYYSRVLQLSGGNVSLAARIAHKTRKEIYEAMRRLGLQLESFRTGPVTEQEDEAAAEAPVVTA